MIDTFWLIEEGKPVKYGKLGECKECGECCKSKLIKFKWTVASATEDDATEVPEEAWTDYENWSVFKAQGSWWYFEAATFGEKRKCASLSEDNACEIWDDPIHFPPVCRYWPVHPDDLKEFPNCGFHFEKVAE